MLLELKVKNFAIIDSVQVHFKPGFNILSGETGAGKSVLLKSLALLMGEKALSDTVRTGADSAIIEGCFEISHRLDIIETLKEMQVDLSDDLLIVRRLISSQGKSRIYLNESLSSLATLKKVVSPLIEVTGQAAPLIEMTGQHDNRHLLSKTYHLDLLDHYTGSWSLRKELSELYHSYLNKKTELEQLSQQAQLREQQLDFLKFQQEEIKQIDLEATDEAEIESSVKKLQNISKLSEFAYLAEQELYSHDHSVLVKIHNLIQQGQSYLELDPTLKEQVNNLAQAKTLIEEAVYELRDYSKNLDSHPQSLQEKEQQLNLFRKLQKKYGATLVQIKQTLEQIEADIERLENSEFHLQQLKNEADQILLQATALAEDLHQRRLNGAKLLHNGVNEELRELNMKGLQFEVTLEKNTELSVSGHTEVEFMTRSAKKEDLKPLAKFASGGELSRILLALKCIIGPSDLPRTYLFDEVDAGVSGPTAEKVGRKLKSIAQGQQVICVTHLPQVSCFADHHFLIQKRSTSQRVKMNIIALEKADRIKEIARLISGEKITKTSLDHAKQLLTL